MVAVAVVRLMLVVVSVGRCYSEVEVSEVVSEVWKLGKERPTRAQPSALRWKERVYTLCAQL